MGDGTVEIICKGEKSKIEEFIEKIRIKEYPIRVDELKASYSEATGEFADFEIIRDEDLASATYERMDMAARYMKEMNANIGNKIDDAGK